MKILMFFLSKKSLVEIIVVCKQRQVRLLDVC